MDHRQDYSRYTSPHFDRPHPKVLRMTMNNGRINGTDHAFQSRKRLTVAVVGLGNIGAGIAGALRFADQHDLIACARRPIDHIILERDGATATLPLRTITEPAQASAVDWVLLCCKAHDTPSTAPWLARLCSKATRVAVLQNGIGHVERVVPFIGGAAAIPSIVYYNGERLSPNHVRLRSVARYDLVVPDDSIGCEFARTLEGTSLNVLLSGDFASFAWRKLLINVVVNPITALTLQRQSVLRRDDVYALGLAVLHEAVAVAQADGARVTNDDAIKTMATLTAYSGTLGTSMYFDRLAGKKLEVDALTGTIVEAGDRHGIPTPLNRALLALLRAISDTTDLSRVTDDECASKEAFDGSDPVGTKGQTA